MSTRAVSAVLIVLFHFVSLVGHTKTPSKNFQSAQTDFLQEASVIPRLILNREPEHAIIGDLDFRKVLNEIPSCAANVSTAAKIDRLNKSGRISAHWRKTKAGYQVTYDSQRWEQKPPRTRAQLAFHECAVHLGFDDDDKRLSMALSVLAFDELPDRQKARLILTIEALSRRRFAGGVVGVGGGEIDTYVFRNRLLEQALTEYRNNPTPENELNLEHAINSNAQIYYFNPKKVYNGIKGGVWTPTKDDIKRARCLIPGNKDCETKSRGLPSETCSCDGVPGTVVFVNRSGLSPMTR